MIQPYEVRPGKCNNLNNKFDDSSKKIVRRLPDLCATIPAGKVNEDENDKIEWNLELYLYNFTVNKRMCNKNKTFEQHACQLYHAYEVTITRRIL